MSLTPGQDTTARCMELLVLDEGYDLLCLVQGIAVEGLNELSEEAVWFVREMPCVPLGNCRGR
ncbi:hypothetical protein [Streptomyces sp. NPDC048641]|uniref:hypothetical protein n=1 Tax=Streptomyces sp. NPDC048641 TaxID=3154825 RepID=UPI003424896A